VTEHVVLLRGVNVGGRNQVPMARLRDTLTAAGFSDVVTYLQSGNVVLGSRKRPASVGRDVAATIEAEFGPRIAVTVRSLDELTAVVASDPFGDVRTDDSRHGVAFLDAEPANQRLAGLDPDGYLPDRIVAVGREIHLWCPNGFQQTLLTNAFLERRLGVVATTRNWRTVLKLRDLAGR
jgi:uncharacterized protein (DUF1697 family)